jgi:hypothetical protein
MDDLISEIDMVRMHRVLFCDELNNNLEGMFSKITSRNKAATLSHPYKVTATAVTGSPLQIYGGTIPIQISACELSSGLILVLMRTFIDNYYRVKIIDTVKNSLRDPIGGAMQLSLTNAANTYYRADMVNLNNGKILVFSGDSIYTYKLFLFDEQTETFTTSFRSPVVGVPASNQMSKLSINHLIPLSDNKILCNLYSNSYNSPRHLYVYHIDKDVCLPSAVSKYMAASDRGHKLLRSPDGQVYYLQGMDAGPSNTNIQIYRFDPDDEELSFVDEFQIPMGNGDITNAMFINPETVWVLYNSPPSEYHYQYSYNLTTTIMHPHGGNPSTSYAVARAPNGDLYLEFLVLSNMTGNFDTPLVEDSGASITFGGGVVAGTVSCKPLVLSDGRILSMTWAGGNVCLNLIDGPFGTMNPYKPSKELLRSGIM